MFFRKKTPVQSPGNIAIENGNEDPPQFHRIYTGKVEGGSTIEVHMHTFLGTRMQDGTLTQYNGKWLIFDPVAVADKILDAKIAEQTQAFVDKVFELDKEYIKNVPYEFIDSEGQRWVKATK